MTDAQALERFEALVLSQQPACQPWQPVTDYSFDARKQVEGKHPELIRDVLVAAVDRPNDSRGVVVLDAGCGPGHLVLLLRELGVQAYGVDSQFYAWPNPYKDRDPNVRYLEWQPWFEVGNIADTCAACEECGVITGADVVICREVLEHLTLCQIRRAVTNLCALSSRFVYLTTRFHLAPTHLLDVMTADDLDPTHISMLHQDFLRVLFVLEGFRRRADLETAMDWQGKGRVLVYERAA